MTKAHNVKDNETYTTIDDRRFKLEGDTLYVQTVTVQNGNLTLRWVMASGVGACPPKLYRKALKQLEGTP